MSVLINFPFLYEDELLYSVFARYHQYTGNENSKTTMDDLFGSVNVCAATLFPSHLKELCKRLPVLHSYTEYELVQQHTLLPYFAPFIPNDRYHELKYIMNEGNGISFYMKLGKTASTVKSPQHLKYCTDCIQEEDPKNGEVYWHRTHQVEGVRVCSKHHKWLIESEIPYAERKNKHEFFSLEQRYSIQRIRR